jgi:hypothetical protein
MDANRRTGPDWIKHLREVAVIFLTLLVVTVALAVFLWAGTLFFQGYIYTEPAKGLYWRGPAAAGCVGVFLGLWCLLSYSNPGSHGTLVNFSPSVDMTFDEFKSRRKGSQQKVVFNNKKKGADFRNAQGDRWAPTSGGAIVESVYVPLDDGAEVEFRVELNEKGNFKRERGVNTIRYLEVGGSRVITDDQLKTGKWSSFSTGLFFLNVLLNLLHLAVWFACLWMLLGFQWPHALGLGLIMWLVMTLAAGPMLLTPAANAGKEAEREAKQPRTSARAPVDVPVLGRFPYAIQTCPPGIIV